MRNLLTQSELKNITEYITERIHSNAGKTENGINPNKNNEMATPYIIYAQIGFSTNRQTFNKNIAGGKISDFYVAQIIVCQEAATAINRLHAVIKMMVGPSESLYRRWL